MKTTKAYQDFLFIARNDWINNEFNNKLAAARLLANSTYRNQVIKITGEVRSVTKELIKRKPNLGRQITEARFPVFSERYQKQTTLENLEITSDFKTIISDPYCQKTIQYIENIFEELNNLLEEFSKTNETGMTSNELATHLEQKHQDVLQYVLAETELIQEAARENRESSRTLTDFDPSIFNNKKL